MLDGFSRTVPHTGAREELLRSENMPLTAVFNYYLLVEKIAARAGFSPMPIPLMMKSLLARMGCLVDNQTRSKENPDGGLATQ